MTKEQHDDLRCTFEDAERNNLLAGMRMSTRAKIEFFEEMIDLAWRTGAIKPMQQAGKPPATATTASSRSWKR